MYTSTLRARPAGMKNIAGVMNILSTVRETGGKSLIDTQKRLQNQLLELLVSSIMATGV
jgi:hypothetical protein